MTLFFFSCLSVLTQTTLMQLHDCLVLLQGAAGRARQSSVWLASRAAAARLGGRGGCQSGRIPQDGLPGKEQEKVCRTRGARVSLLHALRGLQAGANSPLQRVQTLCSHDGSSLVRDQKQKLLCFFSFEMLKKNLTALGSTIASVLTIERTLCCFCFTPPCPKLLPWGS